MSVNLCPHQISHKYKIKWRILTYRYPFYTPHLLLYTDLFLETYISICKSTPEIVSIRLHHVENIQLTYFRSCSLPFQK